ncbi:MAG: helix-turn-helix domain-containing protein [Eubacteriales bacterium]
MTLGQKVRMLRKERRLTQAALCGTYMTRNMLSQIESDSANPSVATIRYLAKVLEVPAGYFLDEEDNLLAYRKIDSMSVIRKYYLDQNYQKCLDACKTLTDFDDELALIMADCYLHIGIGYYRKGNPEGARRAFSLAEVFATRTVYPHEEISRQAAIYLAVMDSVPDGISTLNIPMLAGESFRDIYDLTLYFNLLRITESYKYEIAAQVYDVTGLKNPLYRTHINAKLSLSAGNYERAVALLNELIDRFEDESASLFFRYLIYTDLEEVCKTMGDYKGAYEAGENKRLYEEKFRRSGGVRSDPEL